MKKLQTICLALIASHFFFTALVLAQENNKRVVFIKAKESVLSLSKEIRSIHFDSSQVSPTDEDWMLVKEAVLFNGTRLGKSQLAQSGNIIAFPSSDFKSLIIKYQPDYLARVFDPPFDTIQYNFRGEPISVPDLSIHYKIKLLSEAHQNAFIQEVKSLHGVLDASEPTPPDKITEDGDIPPNDEYYNKQWYLRAGQTYGTEAEKAWEISNDNTDIIIHVNEYANGTISGIDHVDLNANVVYSTFDRPDNDHFIKVLGVASAVTNNSNGVAGTAYNSKLRHASWSSLENAGNHLKAAADYGARVANFSWNSSVDNTQFRDAVEYAFNKGVFMVCSGGNSWNRETVRYPSNYDSWVMAIAPLDSNGARPGTGLPGVLTLMQLLQQWIFIPLPPNPLAMVTSMGHHLQHPRLLG